MGFLLASLLWIHSGLIGPTGITHSQDLPFAKEIAAFKTQDAANPPEKGQVLFIGSSSFTKWTDVGAYFPKSKILNRAFGGSSLVDVNRFVGDVVFPYDPAQIVIYCGENDFAGDPTLRPQLVVGRFETLFKAIRNHQPQVPIVYVSMKPSPSRWNLRDKFQEANREIQRFLRRQKGTAFVDVWPVMLASNGEPRPDIFLSDCLHMNATGYHLWQPLLEKAILPASH